MNKETYKYTEVYTHRYYLQVRDSSTDRAVFLDDSRRNHYPEQTGKMI